MMDASGERAVTRVIRGRATSDGAGVRLTRVISPEDGLDPFLLLDEFGSSEASDYIGGFPDHPHRGFETVTLMREGEMLHRDHLGHEGRLGPGAVQWMCAARGIVHSEMPRQTAGAMRGFQLWLNLPAALKMTDPWYRDLAPEAIPTRELAGATVRAIAGRTRAGGLEVAGAVERPGTDPLYLDVALDAGAALEVEVGADRTALVYGDGAVSVGGRALAPGELAVLGAGTRIGLGAGAAPGRALLLAARPLGEPVVHYGPFVMNTRAEIEQALEDYRAGRLVR